jgi:hypothetical protein
MSLSSYDRLDVKKPNTRDWSKIVKRRIYVERRRVWRNYLPFQQRCAMAQKTQTGSTYFACRVKSMD